MSLSLALALLLAAGLVGISLAIGEGRRRAPLLPPPHPSPPATTALLPVRDEERNVAACLEALLASTARPGILVTDDGSTDRTAEIVAGFAAGDPRVRLLTAPPLPDGWRGKVHAQSIGEAEVRTPWLLCLDADTRHAPELLARAHAAIERYALDAVSLAGAQETEGLGENLLTPGVFALLDALLGDWEAAARGDGAAVANGQFILIRREAWEACGGFPAIRNEAMDDVATFALLRQHGYRTGFLRSSELRVRMYRGLGAAFLGWRRNLGLLFGAEPALLAKLLAGLLFPVAALVAAAVTGRWVAATLIWTAGAASSMSVRTGGGSSPVYGLLYPFDSLAVAATLVAGAVDRRRGRLAAWKGRTLEV